MRRIRSLLFYLLLAQCTYNVLASTPALYSQEREENELVKRDGKGALAKAAGRHGRKAAVALGGVLAAAGTAVGFHKYKKAKTERKAKNEAPPQGGLPPEQMAEPMPGDMSGGQIMRRSLFHGEYDHERLQRRGIEQAGKAMANFFTKPASHALTAGLALAVGGGMGAAAMHHHHMSMPATAMDGAPTDLPPRKRSQSVFDVEDMILLKRDPNAGEMARAIIKPVIQGAKQIKGTTVHVGKDLFTQASNGFSKLPAGQKHKIAAVGAVGAVAATGAGAIALDKKLSSRKANVESTTPAEMQMQAPMQMPMPMKRSIIQSDESLSVNVRLSKRTLEKTASDLIKASSKADKGMSKAGKAGVAVAGIAAVAAAGTWMVNKFHKKPAPPPPGAELMPMDGGGAPMAKRSLQMDDGEAEELQRRVNVLTAGAAAVTTAMATGAAAFHFSKQKGELNVYSQKNKNMGGMGGMGGGYIRRSADQATAEDEEASLLKRDLAGTAADEGEHSSPRMYRRSFAEDAFTAQKRFIAGGEIGDQIFYRREPEPNLTQDVGKFANTVKTHAVSVAGKVGNAAKGALGKTGMMAKGGPTGKALAVTTAAGVGIIGAAVGVKHLLSKKKGSDQTQTAQDFQPAPMKRSMTKDDDEDDAQRLQKRMETPVEDSTLAKRGFAFHANGPAIGGALAITTVAGLGIAGAAAGVSQLFKKRGLGDVQGHRKPQDLQRVSMTRSLREDDDEGEQLQKRAASERTLIAGAGLALATISSVIAHHVGKNEGQIKVLSQKTNAGASGYGGGMYRRSEFAAVTDQQAGLEKRGIHLPNGAVISDGVLLGAGAAITAATGILAEKYGHLEGQLDGMRKSISHTTSTSNY